MTSSSNVVLFLFLWMLSLKFYYCYNTNCDFIESYDEIITVNVEEPVHITKYKWCLNVPPRCPDVKQEHRTVEKNITVTKTRNVKRCCKDQIQLYNNCVTLCPEEECPNIQCAPGTNKCECKSGYFGHLCKQTCDVGHWGFSCKNDCHKACADCDHRTGCCKRLQQPIGSSYTTISGLTFCDTSSKSIESQQANDDVEHVVNDEIMELRRMMLSLSENARTVTTTKTNIETFTMLKSETQKPKSTTENAIIDVTDGQSETSTPERVTSETTSSASPPTKRKDGVNGFIGTVTTMQVTVYKYDELVKKLIWISVMTVIAIAMVFAIMFVVFFNCYGASKVENRTRPTTTTTTTDKVYETCISTKNSSHVPPDRYTKTPVLHKSINDDLPIHPEIFCPVFSAPHYTNGSSLYDSPQPLYEILC